MALLVEGGEALANYLRHALSLVSPAISTCGSALRAPAPTSGGHPGKDTAAARADGPDHVCLALFSGGPRSREGYGGVFQGAVGGGSAHLVTFKVGHYRIYDRCGA